MSERVLIIGAGGVGGVVAHKCAQEKRGLRRRHARQPHARRAARRSRPGRASCTGATIQHRAGRRRRRRRRRSRSSSSVKPDARHQRRAALPGPARSWTPASRPASTTSTPRTTSRPTSRSSSTSGSGRTRSASSKAGLMALLGSGFDPGRDQRVLRLRAEAPVRRDPHVDIVDCNAGSHGKAFATNFNPEINIREITARGRYWENGEWKETEPLGESQMLRLPGRRRATRAYLLYHEELESLVQEHQGPQAHPLLDDLRRRRTSSTCACSSNVGMTRIDPVEFEGQQDRPDQVPEGAAARSGVARPRTTRARRRIGCLIEGVKDGKPKKVFIYNICDHAETLQGSARAGDLATRPACRR